MSDKYYVAGFYDSNKRGLEDNLSTNSADEALSQMHEMASCGDWLFIKNEETGDAWECIADKWMNAIDLGDIPDEAKIIFK